MAMRNGIKNNDKETQPGCGSFNGDVKQGSLIASIQALGRERKNVFLGARNRPRGVPFAGCRDAPRRFIIITVVSSRYRDTPLVQQARKISW